MSELYNKLKELCDKKGIKGAKMCEDINYSKSLMTELKSGRKKSISAEVATKIAKYFDVTVEYLMGETEQKNKAPSENGTLNDNDIKVALFGGDAENISDKAWDEVKTFAQKVAELEKMKKGYNEK